MGSQLVHQVFTLAMADHLPVSLQARMVLVAMAASAHDTGTRDTPQAVYFRGWLYLAQVLGYQTVDRNTPGLRAVTRALAELTAAGLVKREGRGKERFVAAYRLTL